MLKVGLQGLSPAAQLKSQLANARLTKPLTICAGAVAQSVEFTSLTGLPEVQRLSETVREDARWRQRLLRDAHLRKTRDFSDAFAETGCDGLFTRKGLSPLHGGEKKGAVDPRILKIGWTFRPYPGYPKPPPAV